jgi:hypothetical protein
VWSDSVRVQNTGQTTRLGRKSAILLSQALRTTPPRAGRSAATFGTASRVGFDSKIERITSTTNRPYMHHALRIESRLTNQQNARRHMAALRGKRSPSAISREPTVQWCTRLHGRVHSRRTESVHRGASQGRASGRRIVPNSSKLARHWRAGRALLPRAPRNTVA